MAIITDLSQLEGPLERPVLTIGNFDGVHLGHLALFDKVKERARTLDGLSAVMTFDPHPAKVMKPDKTPLLITSTLQKVDLIQRAGIDVVFCLPFDRDFALVSAEDFVEKILVKQIGVAELVVGHDYNFGYQRKGDTQLLKEFGERLGFRVWVLDPVRTDDTIISSTSIRTLLQEGRIRETRRLLGRDYRISGKVIEGKNRGDRVLGFATANLDITDELIPKPGTYVVRVLVDDQVLQGLTHIGYNPTFHNKELSVETHILDFSGNVLGKTVSIEFIERLRDEKRFDSPQMLSQQISRDIAAARDIFRAAPNNG